MKYLLLLMVSLAAQANYIPENKIAIEIHPTWGSKRKCEASTSQICYAKPHGYRWETHDLQTVIVEGLSVKKILVNNARKTIYDTARLAAIEAKASRRTRVEAITTLTAAKKNILLLRIIKRYLLEKDIDPDDI